MKSFRLFLPGLVFAFFLIAAAPFNSALAEDASLPCPPVCGPPPSDSITYLIRNGSASISGSQALQSGGSVDITPDSGTTSPITADARSVISVLKDIASGNPSFSLSHIGFFDFGTPYSGGLYIKCATLAGAATNPSCDNWQYQVNGSSPAVGVGITTIANADSIQLYFGPSRRITPSSSSITIGVPFTVLAESYVASSNSWTPASGLTMRILQGDPFGSPTIVFSATTGADGTATFTINTAGSYTAGLLEDGYYPNTAITASSAPPPAPSGGGGGIFIAQFDVQRAVSFLASQQRADGSFSSTLLSDWAAIAYAVPGAAEQREKLRGFFASSSPELSSVTDYERHAMALEALGINPYSGEAQDYIALVAGAFDGTQIGDAALVNDDIFALFPLMHAGYGADDDIIRKIVAFIISKQAANGSWENSVDLTSAAIQALSQVNSLPDVSLPIANARGYLSSSPRINGGFGNEFSTSWALQAIYALGESPLHWMSGALNPRDYLAALQQSDGGIGPASNDVGTRIWATAYAVPAAEGKTWDSLLQDFDKPAPSAPKAASGAEATSSSPAILPAKDSAQAGATPSAMASEMSSATESVIVRSIPLLPRKKINEAPAYPELTTTPQVAEKSSTTSASAALIESQTAAAATVAGSLLGIDWTFLVYAVALAAAGGMLASLYSLLKALIERFRK